MIGPKSGSRSGDETTRRTKKELLEALAQTSSESIETEKERDDKTTLWMGSVGDKRVYTPNRREAKKLIPVYTPPEVKIQ